MRHNVRQSSRSVLLTVACMSVILSVPARPAASMTLAERRDYLERLQEILPEVPSWRQWLETSGELPPDFDALPRHNSLPDPRQFLDGRPV
ncbi:MAG: hypothetical protein JW993_06500 [Sedimentisphaerales bacterium]|nr:hypothetical protein [Sedimentisphaerales bacterium]